MQHEAARRTRMISKQIVQSSPRLQTVDAHGQIAFGGEAKLREKNLLLAVVIQIGLPAVEADFADGTGNFVEKFSQMALPVRRAFGQVPRMITEAGQHERMRAGKREHLRPVSLARTIHDHARNTSAFAFGEQFHLPAAKTVVLQMIVRVEKFHCPFSSADCRMRSQIFESAL